MRKAVMILVALFAIRLLPKALRQEARALELLTLLFQMTAAASVGGSGSGAANTSKTYATEGRVATLEKTAGTIKTSVTAVQATVTGIQTQLAGNTGFANALGYGPTSTGSNGGVTSGVVAGAGFDSVGPADNGGVTSGQIGGAAAHYHAMSHAHGYSHYHAEAHTHDFGGHEHPL